MTDLRVNGNRLLFQLDELAKIGAIDGGGVCRLAFSREDKAGRDYIEARMRALGLDVSIDGIGNMLGIRAGTEPGPVVVTGSHTDTVGTGGRYDGSLGVLAGLEVIKVLNEAGVKTRHPIGVISFVNEEGVRFMPDMMGSLFLRGDLTIEEARAIAGIDGSTIGQNLDQQDYAGKDDFSTLDIGAFIELHIEQGPVLEAQNLQIGIVDRVQGITWLAYTFKGSANHAGATPMDMRHDAGYAAGALAYRVRHMAAGMGQGQRATIGSINLSPNLINVIAQEASVTVDLRNPNAERLAEAEAQVERIAQQIAEEAKVVVNRKVLAHVAPETFDPACVNAIKRSVDVLGYSSTRLISGAAHDAQILASRWPAAMIFVPSKDGISHNVQEYTAPVHLEAGANVLLHTLVDIAGV